MMKLNMPHAPMDTVIKKKRTKPAATSIHHDRSDRKEKKKKYDSLVYSLIRKQSRRKKGFKEWREEYLLWFMTVNTAPETR